MSRRKKKNYVGEKDIEDKLCDVCGIFMSYVIEENEEGNRICDKCKADPLAEGDDNELFS